MQFRPSWKLPHNVYKMFLTNIERRTELSAKSIATSFTSTFDPAWILAITSCLERVSMDVKKTQLLDGLVNSNSLTVFHNIFMLTATARQRTARTSWKYSPLLGWYMCQSELEFVWDSCFGRSSSLWHWRYQEVLRPERKWVLLRDRRR